MSYYCHKYNHIEIEMYFKIEKEALLGCGTTMKCMYVYFTSSVNLDTQELRGRELLGMHFCAYII